MSGQQQIVEVYQKKIKPDQSGGRNKGKSKNNNKQNDHNQDKNGQQSFSKQQILDTFHQQEKLSLEKQEKKLQADYGYSVEEEKQDFEVKIKQIQDILGDQIGKKQIKNALRANCMNLENTIDQLIKGDEKQVVPSNLTNSGGNRLVMSSTNSNSSDSYLSLKQVDSEEKEAKLRLSQKSSEKDSPIKLKQYQQAINSIKNINNNLREELIIEALEMHQGDVNETLIYLLNDENVKSLEVCLQEHNQDLRQVDLHLDEIVENIIEEEEQNEFNLMMEIQNNDDVDEYNVEEDLYLLNIKKSMSQEEQQDPEVLRFLKISAIFAKQLEILNDINEQKNNFSLPPPPPPKDLYQNQLKKNDSQNIHLKLEYFKEDYLKRNKDNAKNQYIMKESEFPTIIKQKSGPNSILKELQKGNKLEYNPNQNQWVNTTVFQYEGISYLGQQYLQDLSNKFPHVDKETLVDVFQSLDENYEATQQFLISQFGKSNIKQDIKIIRKPPQKAKHSYYDADNEEDEDQVIEEKINKYEKKYGAKSFKDVRNEIINSYQYNKAYQFAERNSDAKAKFNLHKYFQGNSMSLEDMKEYSKALFLRDVRSQNPMCKIDLHGFYAEEALEILKDQIMYMKKLARENKTSNLKIINKSIQLEIVTGRGSHSLGKVSVLKPKVSKFLEMVGYNFKSEEGKIIAKIPY